ncbi:MAG: Bifunctional oligoribonuclease and PAP phosphatase NrnA [Candidatus Ordinivivax streblomastigis]|uniref:Bifunctional oligoribonuclease and PAP phosphatase NrnA n=1 Tax=Candidatus Ordinivivax streblomastigis TaxID=2540710 RepID=A0A5M8NZN4_9BACT|nr:MAG: Bifunctional oligoribonuclease and PAP phosphatase NrnA [Candidatus Ordinivivax streblomastigis]
MLNKIISEHHIQQAKKLIEKYDKIVIVTHVSPDGDAIGSSLAMYHFLLELGKSVNVLVPNNFPGFLKWMSGAKDIVVGEWKPALADELIQSAELIFCLDFNIPKRSGDLGARVEKSSAKKIMIDHHPEPGDFCDITISHPEISSTSELIFRFICRMGMFDDFTRTCAECIYTGMMTDTGSFTYNSNDPHIYYIISELLEKGMDKDVIYDRVYNHCSEGKLRLQGYVLYEKMKIYERYHSALIVLSHEEQQRFQWKRGDTEGLVNMPLSIDGIYFSVFIREEENMIKLSFRSKGAFPANQFASDVFQGGGHLNASGGEFYGTLDEAVAKFETALLNYKGLADEK